MVEKRAKIGEESLSLFRQFSTVSLTINKCKQKHGASEKKDGNCHFLLVALSKSVFSPIGW
jgi:hypothetical protein